MMNANDHWEVDVDELLPEGQVLVVKSDDGPGSSVFFVRLGLTKSSIELAEHGVQLDDESTVVGFLNTCTHMGCDLIRRPNETLTSYHPGNAQQARAVAGPCCCHGTTFDLIRTGKVLFGPATQDLIALMLQLDGKTLKASIPVSSNAPFREEWPNA